ncbi:hypothetical protein BP6252_07174 [Coleophoma cylindrospora]|uniref:G domain-containing protein n=1 Tax=Coleophoma cylindrospora TaxID=1849047 RepID=A0A3D8RGU8_9HELO|nr:hypothetical protein BP6252_07174 [Coleophoma cylindrospora]
MSSPPPTPPLSSAELLRSGRKIAPLPLRSRKRISTEVKSSQNGLDRDESPSLTLASDLRQSPLIGLGTLHGQGTDINQEDTADTSHFSSHTSGAPRITLQSDLVATEHRQTDQEKFTFRFLHNVTPRPSPEPEEASASSSQDPQTRSSHESLGSLLRSEQDKSRLSPSINQPQNIDTNSSSERGIPRIIQEYLDATPNTGQQSSSPIEVSDLIPGPGHLRSRSISDVSILSDNNDALSTYDVRDEEAPLEPFFTPVFQSALQDGLRIAKRTVTAIEKVVGSSGATGYLGGLLGDARKFSTFHTSDTRTIAVLGDSGQGKSSLINALLHFPEIARTGDIGTACTSVVTEYRQKTRDQQAPITIEVEYFSKSEIEEVVKELLWNYRQIFLPDMENDEVDAKEYTRCTRESELAWSALEAGFKHQRSFNKELLRDMSDEGLAKATDQLVQWAHDIEWPDGGTGTWKSTADTAEECCNKTSIFMQDRFWPFTKIIRVYLNAQVLKTGAVLTDLPGLQDTNLARVRATQEYLTKCDNIFIVANISRAISDQSLKSSLYSALSCHVSEEWEESAGKSYNLAVICTKSDDIKQKTARRDFFGPDKEIPHSVMEQLDKDIDDAKKIGDKSAKKRLKRKQEILLIEARNAHVKQGLQDAYSSKVPGGRLKVFCISNTMYEKYSRKGNMEMVQASEIPELRRFCHTITAGAQLVEAKHFLNSELASLLNSAELWASTAVRPKAENPVDAESIKAILQDMKEESFKAVDHYAAESQDTFQEVLCGYFVRRNDAWEDAAKVKAEMWNTWHTAQYNAWCKNNGDHTTPRRGSVNWNSELIWKMRSELAYQWDILEDEIPIVFTELLKSIRLSFLKLKTKFQEQGVVTGLAEGIVLKLRDIEFQFGMLQNEFSREVRLVRAHATEPNASSYIVSEMIPAYRAAAAFRGEKRTLQQKSIVQGKVTDGTVFPLISVRIKGNIDRLIQSTFARLHNKLAVVVQLIDSDIWIAYPPTPPQTRNLKNQEGIEEMRLAVFSNEIKDLREIHGEILASVASM